MRKYLLDLYEIQKIDLEIRDFQSALDAIPNTLRQLEGRLTELQAKSGKVRENSGTALAEAQAMQNLVDEEGRKIRKWESRLNDIRNQREFQALNRETEGSRRANRDTEEKIHELLKSKDGMDQELASLQAQIEACQGQCREEEARVAQSSQGVTGTLEGHRERRAKLIPNVPAALYRKYAAIAARRLGLGLAQVVAGCCQGCNIKLPPQLYNILQRGDTIEQCPSCHRLVFWAQAVAEGAADADVQSATA